MKKVDFDYLQDRLFSQDKSDVNSELTQYFPVSDV